MVGRNIFQGQPTWNGPRSPNGFQRITSLASATALTVPAGTRMCWIQPETQDIRWCDDGTTPTTSIGHLIRINQTFEYTGDMAAIRLIEIAASATVNVVYYK